jgi:hypothetical protein
MQVPLYSLNEVVPQHSRRILQHPDKRRDLHLVVLNRRPVLAVRGIWRVELSKIDKARETPIALLGDETVVCVCRSVIRQHEITHVKRSGSSGPMGLR